MTEESSTDPERDVTPGRGQGQGEWLELRLQEALEAWGYATERRVPIVAQTADVIARRQDLADEPSDYLVAECKDWASRPIDESVINRLCLLAFMARAMPVLCHTSRLTDRAWRLAQAYDVRLLSLKDLGGDDLPPLTRKRPPKDAETHRQSVSPGALREIPPAPLQRLQDDPPEMDLEGPVYPGAETAPCYVTDRTGHEQYTDTGMDRYRRREQYRREISTENQ